MKIFIIFLFLINFAQAEEVCPAGFIYKIKSDLKGCVKQAGKFTSEFIVGRAEFFVNGSWYVAEFDQKGHLSHPYEMYEYNEKGEKKGSLYHRTFVYDNSTEIYRTIQKQSDELIHTSYVHRTYITEPTETKTRVKSI